MEHSLHRHPLTLDTKEGFFTCSTCNQGSCGFMYQCCQKECGFRTDVKCASFVEPFKHPASPDLFFLIHVSDERRPLECLACKNKSRTMTTMTHGGYGTFVFDLKCATLPGFARYKYDTHILTLYGVFMGVYWCEICEEEIQFNRVKGYYHFVYTCTKCCTTVHADCILGKHPYMKPGRKTKSTVLRFILLQTMVFFLVEIAIHVTASAKIK
ncbi:unnamed protein product [Arabis nemorensis]|uniref:DC1 domain-containing protein n=1 Tax=Arabis nemorensis TaxID=586526 RepID=A0A565C1S6_9BRAS|nr:unnamed protein product [Arabis nemorensis]